jgi:tripartite-type tricarboxylate transporter receptor subunit TctC
MKFPRRRSLHLVARAGSFAAVTYSAAYAQGWPSGPIRIVIPFAPGGSTDVIARLAQPGLQQRLGTTVIIENRPGGSGTIGAGIIAKSAPDGNTWLLDFDTHAANPFTVATISYDTEKDFDPVPLIGTAPYVLSTPTSRPFKTFADVAAAAKQAPLKISLATVGAGSIEHLAMTMLSKRAGITLVHVPYRGGGPQMNDLIAGHVDLAVASTAATLPLLQTGAVRPIVQTGAVRASTLANVPTVAESGFAGFEAYAWWGLFAPTRTPQDIKNRVAAEFTSSLRDERVINQLIDTQQIALDLSGPDKLRSFLREQMNLWGPIAREQGIKAEE